MIDWDRVATLREEVGEESFDEVVAMFLEEVEEVIARFRAGSDPAGLERDLHFLKGGVLNLGFADLGRLCEQGEQMAAAGRAGSVDVAAVVRLYEGSLQVFLGKLKGMRAA